MSVNPDSQSSRPVMLSNVIQMLQLLTLIIGLTLVAANMGAKGEVLNRHDVDLKDLKAIVQDLVKFQVSTTKDNEKLRDLETRVRALETHGPSR